MTRPDSLAVVIAAAVVLLVAMAAAVVLWNRVRGARVPLEPQAVLGRIEQHRAPGVVALTSAVTAIGRK
ncbi:MAG: hypothetical protein J0I70_03110 [Microbacterium sp.]|uniref:hypothetical protein n=1 Tax=Microbacterium sp. TaxID=51671 RepID=UPI001ACED3D1|nr:hypothetical protein [Microbacterium sp.]MBN9173128.1 hypothetical protein [Microbacterium sp.]